MSDRDPDRAGLDRAGLGGDVVPNGAHETVRSEEELVAETRTREVGRARVIKHVDTERVSQIVGRDIEHAETERVAVQAGDSGEIETLADGSVSIPVFEEELVIEKRLVVRERIIIRKHTVTEEQRVEADLRRERVHVDVDETVADRVVVGGQPAATLAADTERPPVRR